MSNNLQIDSFNKIQRGIFKFAELYLNDFCVEFLSLIRWHGSYKIFNPKTFNEKIHWLKLFNRKKEYINLTDKLNVKDFVENKIGDKYIIKTIGFWDNVSSIPWEDLPKSFVIKTNHASGSTFIVKNKEIDLNQGLINSLNKWMKIDFYKSSREHVYKGIKRKIFVEELIQNNYGEIPKDYKFFCFNGKPQFVQVDIDRFKDHKRAFYTLNWTKLPFTTLYKQYEGDIKRPKNFLEMISVAEKLSEGLTFIRVDLYDIEKVYFGELTFFPGGGNEQFYPNEWDKTVGKMLIL